MRHVDSWVGDVLGSPSGAAEVAGKRLTHLTSWRVAEQLLRIVVSSTGNESHAGQVFTCIGALALADALHLVDRDLFCWW